MKRLLTILVLTALLWQVPASAQGTRLFVIVKATGTIIPINAELANTPEKRMQGLMFREHLGTNEGMWFQFSKENFSPFWMKNTPLSLDMLFVNDNGRIVDIISDTRPYSLDSLWPRSPYYYVLEVAAGFSKKNKVAIGDLIQKDQI